MISREFLPNDDAYKIVTRQEHSRSLEDAEKYQAIEQLKSVGLLVPMASFQEESKGTKFYHGRAREDGEKGTWQVNQWFDNSDDNTGNANVNKVPSLAVGSFDVAKQFADARSRGWGNRNLKKSEVHEIISNNPDAVILDQKFSFNNLSPENQTKTRDSLKQLTISELDKTLLSFEEREVLERIKPSDFNVSGHTFLTDADVGRLAGQFHVSVEGVRKIAGALNASQMLVSEPRYIADPFLKGHNKIKAPNGPAPLNIDYVAGWMRNANIVGMQYFINSATLGRTVEAVFLFDLQNVNTRAAVMDRRGKVFQKYRGITDKIGDLLPAGEQQEAPILSLLANQLHVKPEQLVEGASQVADFRQNYEADAGNWERFRLGEHTETVLRVFDENYADHLPVELLPIMRLALLTHDLGKPQAVADGRKKEQLTYNLKEAVRFCVEAGASKQLTFLVHAMISAEPYTFGFFKERIKGDYQSSSYQQAKQAFLDYSAERLGWLSDGAKPTENEITGFANMCLLLQACDSAAYTNMAVTRSAKTGGRYRNAPSFNASFKSAAGLTKQVAEPKGFRLA